MNNIPTLEQRQKMQRADERLSNIILHYLNKDSMMLIPQIISKSSGASTELGWLAREGYEKGLITIYEAFQLNEICDRLCFWRNGSDYDFWEAVGSLNMALMAKLFEEEDMYRAFCADAEYRYDSWVRQLLKLNNGKLPKPKKSNELFDDFRGFLKGEKEHLELLSYKRSHIKGAAKQNAEGWHFCVFPFDLFKYEDELLKVVTGKIEHYPVDKTISPIVCDIMTAAEIRDYEVKKGYF